MAKHAAGGEKVNGKVQASIRLASRENEKVRTTGLGKKKISRARAE